MLHNIFPILRDVRHSSYSVWVYNQDTNVAGNTTSHVSGLSWCFLPIFTFTAPLLYMICLSCPRIPIPGFISLPELEAGYPLSLPVPILSRHEEAWSRLVASSQWFYSQPKHMWVSVMMAQTKPGSGLWGTDLVCWLLVFSVLFMHISQCLWYTSYLNNQR